MHRNHRLFYRARLGELQRSVAQVGQPDLKDKNGEQDETKVTGEKPFQVEGRLDLLRETW